MKNRVLIFLFAMSLIAAGCGPQTGAEDKHNENKSKVVEAYTIKNQTEPLMLSATGVVEAKSDIPLSFGTSGKIVSILVQKGSTVGKGQLLASLDTSYYQSAVAAASGQVQQASVLKRETLKGASAESIAQQRLQVQSANQNLDKAKKDLVQGETLFSGGAISQNEFNQLKLDVNQAEINTKNEEIALTSLLKGANPEDVARVAASLTQASSEVARAQQTLKETKLVAPFAGTIVDVGQQVGELTNPGQNVLHLVDLSEIKVKIDVANDLIYQYKEGSQVQLGNESGMKTTGKITYVSPVIDEKTGKYQVEITAANPKRDWRGGMLAQVDIPRKLAGLIVPLESVGISQTKRYVLAIENGVVKKREVEIGQVIEDKVEIIKGIKAGDIVIKSGITYYVDGEKVEAKGE